MELRDGDLVLRPPTRADVPAIVEACQDADLVRFIPGFPSPYRKSDAKAWLARKAGPARTFLIVDSETDRLLGAIEVRVAETGSIGYWVRADARGRDVATRATKLLARWALTKGGVERLELTTDVDNVASQRVAEKAGFTREGVLRAHLKLGKSRRDSVMFSLLPGDLGGA
jgi:RimJ/RimL family protein N-acetyltransferase